MAAGTHIIESEPYPDWRCAGTALVVCATWVAFCMWRAMGWQWCLPGAVLLIFAAGTLQRRAILDLSSRVLSERTSLFGHKLVSLSVMPLSEFTAVAYSVVRGSGEGGTTYCEVGLRHRSGREFWLRRFEGCFDGIPGRQAEEFAWRLHCDTGIEIDEHVD